jgi:hypothetical protein
MQPHNADQEHTGCCRVPGESGRKKSVKRISDFLRRDPLAIGRKKSTRGNVGGYYWKALHLGEYLKGKGKGPVWLGF